MRRYEYLGRLAAASSAVILAWSGDAYAHSYVDTQEILDSNLDVSGYGTQISISGSIAPDPTPIFIGDTLTIDVNFSSPIFDPRCCSGTGVYDEGSFPDTDGFAGWLATIDSITPDGGYVGGFVVLLQTFSMPGNYTNSTPIFFQGSSFDLSPVPELGTWMLMLVGVSSVGVAMRTARRGALG